MQRIARKRTSRLLIVLLSLVVALTFTVTMTDNADASAKEVAIKHGSKTIVVGKNTKKEYKIIKFKTLQKKLGKFKRYKSYDYGKQKGYICKKNGIKAVVVDNKERKSIGPFRILIKTKKASVWGVKVGMPAKKAMRIFKKKAEDGDGGFYFCCGVKMFLNWKKGKITSIELVSS